MSRSRARIPPSLALLLLAAAVLALYLPGARGPYMLDDLHDILLNPSLMLQESRGLLEASLSSGSGPLRRPVSMLSFALNLELAGDADPYSFKLVNIVLHLITGLGLYLLSLRLLARLMPAPMLPDGGRRRRQWTALLVTALWLLHPLHVSTVLYVVQRMTILAALFSVWALVAYAAGRERLLRGERFGLAWIALALGIGGALATLSKENGALLPVFALVLELTVFRFAVHPRLAPAYARMLRGLLAVPVIALLAYLVHYTVTDGSHTYEVARAFTLGERLLTEARALWFYAGLLLWPNPRAMALFHDDFAASLSLLTPPTTILAVSGLLIALGLALQWRRRSPVFALAVLWFLAGHLLESTVVPLELVFEHRNYLPSFGPLFALGFLVARLPHRAPVRTFVAVALAAAVIALWTDGTVARVHQWSDHNRLWLTELRHHPDSARTQFTIGGLIATNGYRDVALPFLERAAELNPRETGFVLAAIATRYEAGGVPDPQWVERAVQRLRANPLSAMTQIQMKGLLTARAVSGDPRLTAPTDRLMAAYVAAVLGRIPVFTAREADSALAHLASLLLHKTAAGAVSTTGDGAGLTPEQWTGIALGQALYQLARHEPEPARDWLGRIDRARLGTEETRLLVFMESRLIAGRD